jgi:hypothetical protein
MDFQTICLSPSVLKILLERSWPPVKKKLPLKRFLYNLKNRTLFLQGIDPTAALSLLKEREPKRLRHRISRNLWREIQKVLKPVWQKVGCISNTHPTWVRNLSIYLKKPTLTRALPLLAVGLLSVSYSLKEEKPVKVEETSMGDDLFAFTCEVEVIQQEREEGVQQSEEGVRLHREEEAIKKVRRNKRKRRKKENLIDFVQQEREEGVQQKREEGVRLQRDEGIQLQREEEALEKERRKIRKKDEKRRREFETRKRCEGFKTLKVILKEEDWKELEQKIQKKIEGLKESKVAGVSMVMGSSVASENHEARRQQLQSEQAQLALGYVQTHLHQNQEEYEEEEEEEEEYDDDDYEREEDEEDDDENNYDAAVKKGLEMRGGFVIFMSS